MQLDRERMAWVLLDALSLGDNVAARKWKLCARTVQRYRERMRIDPELSSVVAEKAAGVEVELASLRVRFLRKALRELETKITAPEATVYEIAGAVKIVGELHQVSEALGDERSDGEDPNAAEDADGLPGEVHASH